MARLQPEAVVTALIGRFMHQSIVHH